MATVASSPASSGPAGSHFEGQIGAYYLLSMLVDTEPRGLPGTAIDQIAFQRAGEGRALDDVIVYAHDARGVPCVLEIQVKRSITFSPGDDVFKSVVYQIVKASLREDFWTSHYELAIATSQTSRKIDGAYQDVLTWARLIGDSATFTDRINRPGSANPDMRSFVQTFRSHLHSAGLPADDEMVWRLLRRLQILVFDFTAPGSASEELAKERAARALHSDDTARAGSLWSTLTEFAIRIAASGGDRTRADLTEDLRHLSFRLAGSRRYSSARAAIAEASRLALADICDRVGDVMLTRHERLASIHATLDDGRYIDIRGESGVGKSGLLKHLASQVATEAQVIVLSPNRTTPKGWLAFRAILFFDGSAHDLLSDLAGDGGAFLFVDNIDLFSEEERVTVIDLVRAAADVPRFAVVSTGRLNFGVDESNWLPRDALDRLGQTDPIVINELSNSEIEEIQHAAPRLASLLADGHPARDVTRNLFRLARLASRPQNEPYPRTEAEMAEQWWQTADGRLGDGHRERMRLLKALAEHALLSAEPLNVANHPSAAIESLVASETLREQGTDHVVFRHDVLREWAIANLLHAEPVRIGSLPLGRPAPAAFARGIELTARMAIEHSDDSTHWKALLDRLSLPDIHRSWRRAALLALIHSEMALELLTRASNHLFADRAIILREIIRTVLAVDAQPASNLLVAAGFAAEVIPPGLNAPSGPAWSRLIRWLLIYGEALPAAAVPDVVDLYTDWSNGTLALDPLTPKILAWLHHWLTQIETARNPENLRDRDPFNGEIDHDRASSLESNLRTGFLLYCNEVPALAVEYMQSVGQNRRSENTVRSILKFRGRLAQAAPAELAEMTANALIKNLAPPETRHYRRQLEEPFDFADHLFLPASPANGPFLELLTHAPQHGLSLIYRLVTHAISFYTSESDYGDDAFTISFSDGDRVFPWGRSYLWSRNEASHSCVTSGLMALEAWAHSRIEAGEPFDKVLVDVLGPPGSPAAYLLVAVDLLLSHWPASREASVPFLGCPELLCIDRQRQLHDNYQYPDLFGLEELHKNAPGAASLENLKNRPSRGRILENVIGQFAVFGPFELRAALTALLHRAAERVGPFGESSNLGDPCFIVVYALNLVDPDNWCAEMITFKDGTQQTGHKYVPPEYERRHLASLQEASRHISEDFKMQSAVSLALEDLSHSSAEFASTAANWAQNVVDIPKEGDVDEDWIRKEAILTAAMVVMRDGDADLRVRHEAWARAVFAQALRTKSDPVHRIRSGLRYNLIAIAFAGLVYLLKYHAGPGDVRTLLEVAGRDNPAAAQGFDVVAVTLASIDERLPRAVLRCAFAGSVKPTREWDLAEKEVTARLKRHLQRVRNAVDAELAWLAGKNPEPGWPAFVQEEPTRRRRLIVGGQGQETIRAKRSRPKEHVDHQAAALWLSKAGKLFNAAGQSWLCDIVRNYGAWTAAANGASVDINDEISNPPSKWNNIYFHMLAHSLSALSPTEADLALASICSLADAPFCDVLTQFLQSYDVIYFNSDAGTMKETAAAVNIRAALASRMMACNGWRRLGGSRGSSIEIHIGPAIATLFFNEYYAHFPPGKCYLLAKGGIDRVDSFLGVLEKLTQSGPSLFVAIVTLNLVEVSPRSSLLSFVVAAAKAWLASYPNDSFFWVDQNIGRRVCIWVGEVWRQEPDLLNTSKTIRFEVDILLAALISMGVADARRLEETLGKSIKN